MKNLAPKIWPKGNRTGENFHPFPTQITCIKMTKIVTSLIHNVFYVYLFPMTSKEKESFTKKHVLINAR